MVELFMTLLIATATGACYSSWSIYYRQMTGTDIKRLASIQTILLVIYVIIGVIIL